MDRKYSRKSPFALEILSCTGNYGPVSRQSRERSSRSFVKTWADLFNQCELSPGAISSKKMYPITAGRTVAGTSKITPNCGYLITTSDPKCGNKNGPFSWWWYMIWGYGGQEFSQSCPCFSKRSGKCTLVVVDVGPRLAQNTYPISTIFRRA